MMKPNVNLKTRAAPELAPGNAALVRTPARGWVEARLEDLKQRSLKRILAGITDPRLAAGLRWAAHEAAALAWMTPFPFLFFPSLLEEKVRLAKVRWQRQIEILRRSQAALSPAG